MKYIIAIMTTILIIYLFQTTINNENRIVNLGRLPAEAKYE